MDNLNLPPIRPIDRMQFARNIPIPMPRGSLVGEVVEYDAEGRATEIVRYDMAKMKYATIWRRSKPSEPLTGFILTCILIAMVSFIAGRVVEASVEGQYSSSSVQTLSGQQ